LNRPIIVARFDLESDAVAAERSTAGTPVASWIGR
jgi:hypothetical protein